ncbi:hypothetical protein [Methylomonas rhizoryzae]|uniref:hypothetical protein n=1 Tax=Methylomonas rhizoryzae TaxID=2608981 RepID=UPI0012327D30|nr:hypothetical protein [Methylomonas rhizoryzae]
MDTADLVKELWSIANIVTGFAVMQGLGFSFALGDKLRFLQNSNGCVQTVLALICVAITGMYCFAVWRLEYLACSHIDRSLRGVWREITIGRIAAIAVFNAGLPVFAIYAKAIFSQ